MRLSVDVGARTLGFTQKNAHTKITFGTDPASFALSGLFSLAHDRWSICHTAKISLSHKANLRIHAWGSC